MEKSMLYGDYAHCAHRAFTAWMSGSSDTNAIGRWLTLHDRLRFLTPREVFDKAVALNEGLGPIITEPATNELKAQISEQYITTMANFARAGRKELGTD